MLYEYDKKLPKENEVYTVWAETGVMLGDCHIENGMWYDEYTEEMYDAEGTYFSDNVNDPLKMIEQFLKNQKK